MKNKLFIFSLLVFAVFGIVSPSAAYAKETDEMKYMEYIDDKYSLSNVHISYRFEADAKRQYEFLGFGFGNILSFSNVKPYKINFYADFNVKYLDVADVGVNPSDMIFRVDIDYLVFDENMNVSNVSYAYDLALLDVFQIGVVDAMYLFDYVDLISFCDCPDGSLAVIDSISFTIYSGVLNRCGTTYIYKLKYEDDLYTNLNVVSIEQYKNNSEDGLFFLSDLVDVWNPGGSNYCCTSVSPDNEEWVKVTGVTNSISDIVLGFPGMLVSFFSFIINFLNLLPDLLLVCVPFLPDVLAYGFCYMIYFLVALGIFKLFKS